MSITIDEAKQIVEIMKHRQPNFFLNDPSVHDAVDNYEMGLYTESELPHILIDLYTQKFGTETFNLQNSQR